VWSILRAFTGWKKQKEFSQKDNFLRHSTATVCHIQLIIGLYLYSISPFPKYLFSNFPDAVHEREVRFFGIEHITMMLLAIILITIGSAKAKRKKIDEEKFKTLFIWFGIGLLIILSSIPWEFSPLTSRPSFRGL
jgi:hypothetical protein